MMNVLNVITKLTPRKNLEVHDDGYNEKRNLELMVRLQSFECEDCDTKSNVEDGLNID